jgi:hypothetical protein
MRHGLWLLLFLTASARADTFSLWCDLRQNVNFSAEIQTYGSDLSTLQAVNYANVSDNYAHAKLICTARGALEELACIGYVFDNPADVVEVKISKKDGKYFATTADVRGRPGVRAGARLPCELKKAPEPSASPKL